MADFQDILARLTATGSEGQSPRSDQAQNPIWASQPGMPQRPSYHQPSVSSPIFSPQPGGPQPIHSSAIMSPNLPASSSATPQPETSSRTNLLNLLKFAPSGQDSSRSSSAILNPQLERSRTSSGDQAASFVPKPPLPSMLSRPDMKGESTPSSSDDPQQSLLKLLNQRGPSQSSIASNFGGRAERIIGEDQAVGAAPSDKMQEIPDTLFGASDVGSGTGTVRRAGARDDTPIRVFGSGEPGKPSNLKNSIFNYVNPFDELSASSPQNRTPRTEIQKDPIALRADLFKQGGDLSSRTHDRPEYGTSAPVSKSRKLSPGVSRELSSREPSAQGDGRTPAEALMGIDAKNDQTEDVSQTLSDLAKTLEKPVEEAMSQLNVNASGHAQHENEKVLKSEKGLHDLVEEVQEVAKDMHEELKDKEARKKFEKNMPADVAEAVEDTVEDLVHGVPEDWEDMDELASSDPRVFTFPMRPFHAIDIQPTHALKPSLREGGVMDIARFKKDFDQLDRNLASATKSFITYAALKHGGFRLIHQGSGKDKHVFRGPSNADRVFNIAMCSSSAPSQHADVDAVIATGLDGSVYWTAVNRSRGDGFDDEDLGREGFIFPPAPSTDDNTSGAQLKTRAKPSARHTEYFAIGRGKSIYIVWPYVIRTRDYTDQKTRIVDTAKYFRHFQLVISTGKAAKDFAFSEDDTVIVSLDKSGKMKFWDIRELVDSLNSIPTPPKGQFELRTPKMTFVTTAPNEKSWPTSIMFIDKERPYLKGGAIRYLIVGFKQNHTLQLWDLGLKKAVQELNFPHDNEIDPICSLAYHPRTGVLALGHPTRNSIFLIHVSCPKYNLGHMSQAKYIQRLASQDSTLPGPESTAIMSGVREVSFASKGQLRSIGMQDKPITENEEDEPMFELYVMHSKGVTCLTITKSDIGWTKENKPIKPVNGEEEGFIVVHDLQPGPITAPSEPSINGDSLAPTPAQKRSGKSSRASQTATPEPTVRASSALRHTEKHVSDAASTNGGDKTDKKNHDNVVKPSVTSAVDPSLVTPSSFTRSNLNTETPTATSKPLISEDTKAEAMSEPAVDVEARAAETAGASKTLSDVPIVDITRGMVHDFSTTVNEQLEALHRRLDDDKRVQDAAGSAKQDAILRLVSSTLTENVEKSLNRIISTNIEKVLLPTVTDATTKALEQKLPNLLGEHLRSNLPKDIKSALPGAVSTAMQGPNILRSLSENVTEKLTQHVERQLQTSLSQTIIPAFNHVATQEAQNIGGKLETRVGDQLRKVEAQRAHDNQKLDQITSLVHGLSETIRAMANAQGTFQSEILKLQNQVAQQLPQQQKPIGSERATGAASRAATEPEPESRPQSQLQSQKPNPEDEEVENITSLMQEGRYEEGTIQWLQSKRQGALFARLFYRVNPPYLARLSSPLIALSCAAAVSMDLSSLITERLNWLETVLSIIENYHEQTGGRMDDDTREVCPNIMEVITERLQKLYARLTNEEADEETIRRIPFLARRANSIKEGSGVGVGLGA